MVSTAGSRRMESGGDAVLDPNLRVRGIERRRDGEPILFAKMHRRFPNQPPSIKFRRSF